MPADHQCLLSRRRLFLLAGAGIAARLPLGAATAPDFWNKKAPADWTNEEIDRLIAKSPWAKPVKASYAPGEAPYDTNPGGNGTGTGGGYPGGGTEAEDIPAAGPAADTPAARGAPRGGIGIPGLGGLNIPGMGRGRKGGGAASPYEGTVRWESARPILDAMKAPLPEAFEGRYVISVSGIPLMGSRSTVAAKRTMPTHRAATNWMISTVSRVSAVSRPGAAIPCRRAW